MNQFVQFIPAIFAIVLMMVLRRKVYPTMSGKIGDLLRAGLMSLQGNIMNIIMLLVIWFIFIQILGPIIGGILYIFLPATATMFISTVVSFIVADFLATLIVGWWASRS